MRYGASVEVGGMLGGRDPAVKLFGRKIPLPEEQQQAEKGDVADWAPLTKVEKDSAKEKANTEVNATKCIEDEQKASADISKGVEDPKSEQDKETETLKRPDKVLQCPRCNSMDTKFCYYNNYNVNQPRYFCKNCQRYWTSGGTMRNVPVGAGRRKNKHSALTFRHAAQADTPDQTHHQTPLKKTLLEVNGAVLKFGADTRCESIASVINTEEQKKAEEPSCSSSVTASKYAENDFTDDAEQKAFAGFNNGAAPFHQLQCFPFAPWPYAWSDAASMPWCQPQMVTAPAFCGPFPFPFPFVPASFWGCAPSWAGRPWNPPVAGSNNGLLSPLSTTTTDCLGNGSPTLGKHCRDTTSPLGEGKPEKSLWVPKTSRVDDIDEVARSSIFAILGIKPDEDRVFKAFKKGEAALHANPAALSRSQAFQETTN